MSLTCVLQILSLSLLKKEGEGWLPGFSPFDRNPDLVTLNVNRIYINGLDFIISGDILMTII